MEDESHWDKIRKSLSEQFVERSYSVKEFFYDNSFNDYRVKFLFTAKKPTRYAVNYDYMQLYPQLIHVDYPARIRTRIDEMQSIGRIERTNPLDASDLIIHVTKSRYYDAEKAKEITNRADVMLKKMMDIMKEYNVSYAITAEQRPSESGFRDSDIKL